MGKVASKYFGEIELNHGRDHCFEAKHDLSGAPLRLDLNVTAHDHFDEAALRKMDYRLRFLPELVDQVREMIAEELDQDGTNPSSSSTSTAPSSRKSSWSPSSACATSPSSPTTFSSKP